MSFICLLKNHTSHRKEEEGEEEDNNLRKEFRAMICQNVN
jgi:hypothetical protein